jgi:hypothetical protein
MAVGAKAADPSAVVSAAEWNDVYRILTSAVVIKAVGRVRSIRRVAGQDRVVCDRSTIHFVQYHLGADLRRHRLPTTDHRGVGSNRLTSFSLAGC